MILSFDKRNSKALFIQKKEEEFEYWVSEHLRMSGLYWGLSGIAVFAVCLFFNVCFSVVADEKAYPRRHC